MTNKGQSKNDRDELEEDALIDLVQSMHAQKNTRDSLDSEDEDGGGSGTGDAEISSEALAEYIGSLIGSSPYTHQANIQAVLKSVQEGKFNIPEDTEILFEKDEKGDIIEVKVAKKADPKKYAEVDDRRFAVTAKSIKKGESTKKPMRRYEPDELKKERPLSPWKTPTPKPPGM